VVTATMGGDGAALAPSPFTLHGCWNFVFRSPDGQAAEVSVAITSRRRWEQSRAATGTGWRTVQVGALVLAVGLRL
jgi:hypothetical protein